MKIPPLRPSRTRHFSSAAVALLALCACGSPSNNGALFTASGAHANSEAGAMNSAGGAALAGAPASGAGSGGTGISSAGGASDAGGSAGGGASAGPNPSTGGVDEAGGSTVDPPLAGGAGSPGAGVAGSASVTADCSPHGAGATFYSGTQHCYLVLRTLSTYADAQAHCVSLGAHLVSIANEDENAFVWSLDSIEHWIGTSDNKGPKEMGAGTYTWLTGEPFDYSAWSAAQPNASKTSCGNENGGGDCYEHCGFQWTGGEHDGQWNDRYCMHTIEAVCEWEK